MSPLRTLPPLIPPFRFGTVEDRLYRGAYPKSRNLRFLKRLKLKTLLSLVPDSPNTDADIRDFCAQQGIRLIHLKVGKMKENNIPLSYGQTVQALQIIIDAVNLPVYVHCLDGADVTGLVVACLRRVQMWNVMSAMIATSLAPINPDNIPIDPLSCLPLSFLRASNVSSDATGFVERFTGTSVDVITVPREIPPWLWGGSVTFRRHPMQLRFKFLNPEIVSEEEREARERGASGALGGSGAGGSGA
ncbi:tyrosine phosphatase family-domain-containing protein, partial [Jimgerdemannia flammicorona]